MTIDFVQIEPGIGCVTIANPRRLNALTLEMFESLAGLWPELARRDELRVVVLRGSGGNFCSGADLSVETDRRPGVDDLIDRALLKTALFPIPLVAAIEGVCVAGGLELALAADVRVAAQDARLGFPEVHWGILPSGGGAMKLSEQIGQASAMDLLLTARLIDGVEAGRIGLVGTTAQAADVWPLALDRARMIARNAPVAVRATKRAALDRRSAAHAAAEAAERALVAELRRTGAPDEGKAAFREGRPPAWARPVGPD